MKRIDGQSIIKTKEYHEFKGLQKENYNFISNKIILNGEIYYYDKKENKDIIIFSNGFKMTIKNYLHEISLLASLGYIVYTYDYAGVGISEGKKFKGMPQAIKNLKDCITKVKELNKNSKIILVGHSMGGYASCNVLNFESVNKVIAISPFNNIVDVVQDNIISKLGKKIFLFPIIYKIYLYFKFGSFSSYSTFNTLKYTNKKILVIQGEEDKTVLPNKFINSMMCNNNGYVSYLLLENKNHFPLLSSDAMNYDLFLKHQISDLNLKYGKKIPDNEINLLNENINFELKYKFDQEVITKIKNYLKEV